MTIHYHGTPITPRSELYKMRGKHLCVSFANPGDSSIALEIAQSILWDNGAFTTYTKGKELNKKKLYTWLESRLQHPHRAIILDKIGGNIEEQREYIREWPFSTQLSWPVWHLDKPLSYAKELADKFGTLCLGSSGEFWQIGTSKWNSRIDKVFNMLWKNKNPPWIHGLRMTAQCGKQWPFSSVDSSNVARNHNPGNNSIFNEDLFEKDNRKDIELMARNIDSVQCPLNWIQKDVSTILDNYEFLDE